MTTGIVKELEKLLGGKVLEYVPNPEMPECGLDDVARALLDSQESRSNLAIPLHTLQVGTQPDALYLGNISIQLPDGQIAFIPITYLVPQEDQLQ